GRGFQRADPIRLRQIDSIARKQRQLGGTVANIDGDQRERRHASVGSVQHTLREVADRINRPNYKSAAALRAPRREWSKSCKAWAAQKTPARREPPARSAG